MTNVMHKFFSMYLFLFITLYVFRARLLPTCTHLGHQHRMTVTTGCIDTICLSWWWARHARNTWRVINRNKYIEKNLCITLVIWYQWPRGLRRRSSAARLLKLCVRIPSGAWMFVCLSDVSVMCCQVEVSATGWSLIQRESTDCAASKNNA